jgi:phenylacetate-CoA ligase
MLSAEPFDALDRLRPAELERWWVRRLRSVCTIAARELPFYRQRFEAAGFEPASLRTLDDLGRIPILAKPELLGAQRQAGGPRMGIERGASVPVSRTTFSLSSGTAGTTFITHTARWRREQGLSSCRAHWWAGARPGGTLLMSAPAWHSYAAIQPFIAMHFGMRCVVISGTYLARFAERIVDAIVHFKPRFVTMFLPMVFSILDAARRRAIGGRQLFAGVASLVVTGAAITPGMREHLKDVTGVERLAEIAGTSENLLAVDCAYGQGLHLVPDTCHAQVIDIETGRPVADRARGSVVHSSLIPYGSLYLRYDSGDVGSIDHAQCPCGLPSPRIKLFGRWEDRFMIGDRVLLPYDVQLALEEEVPELKGTPCIIIREGLTEGKLELLVIEPERALAAAVFDGARASLSRRFEVRVEITPVKDLPLRFKGVPPIVSTREAAR